MLQWLENHRELAILLVPALAFLEACIGIGLFVSGILLVIASSMIYANGIAPLGLIMAVAFVGATLGDHTGFFIGRWIGPRFHHLRIVQKNRSKMDKAEAMIRKSGAFSIFIGRFVPAIRSLIPAVLGVSEFQALRYSVFDLLACLLWCCALGAIVAGVAQF